MGVLFEVASRGEQALMLDSLMTSMVCASRKPRRGKIWDWKKGAQPVTSGLRAPEGSTRHCGVGNGVQMHILSLRRKIGSFMHSLEDICFVSMAAQAQGFLQVSDLPFHTDISSSMRAPSQTKGPTQL